MPQSTSATSTCETSSTPLPCLLIDRAQFLLLNFGLISFLTLSPRSWSSRSCWGCHITDEGLIKIASADCVRNLMSISLWGLAGITDKGVVHLVSTGSFSFQLVHNVFVCHFLRISRFSWPLKLGTD
jgi:hypothetical protein